MGSPPRERRIQYERTVVFLGVLAGVPGMTVSLVLLWTGAYPPRVQWTTTVVMLVLWWGVVFTLRQTAVRPLQTLSNILAALLEGDYSFRSRTPNTRDALGLAFAEVNALGERLREERLGALEATALLRTVMDEIDVAIFAFDAERRVRLVNQAGERLLARPAERIVGYPADAIGLAEYFSTPRARIVEGAFPGRAGRFELRVGAFRQGGVPHQLLVLTDLSRALREEERQAWKRIIRVLGHEINNSLAPIRSIAGSLGDLLQRRPRPADLEDDLQRGLRVIMQRSEALGRFMGAYARLARLPPPKPDILRVSEWIRRAVQLERRVPIKVREGPDICVHADGDQLEQVLINLLRNAADAVLETGGAVRVTWDIRNGRLEVIVEDEGPGLPETANLFVPFFTTKPGGTGIGLVLSREIAENHNGALTLENREVGRGCRARLSLPVATALAVASPARE